MYLFAALVYFVICFALSYCVKRLQNASRSCADASRYPSSASHPPCHDRNQERHPSGTAQFQVLTDCTTSVDKGEVVVVCGPSGSGKSTLIKTRQRARAVPEGRDHRRRHLGQRSEDEPAEAARARRHGVPAFRAVSAPDASRENLTLAQIKVLGPHRRRGERARHEDARPRRPRPRTRTSFPGSSPAASSSASPSRARCRWTRSACCSTSRPRRSTPR